MHYAEREGKARSEISQGRRGGQPLYSKIYSSNETFYNEFSLFFERNVVVPQLWDISLTAMKH